MASSSGGKPRSLALGSIMSTSTSTIESSSSLHAVAPFAKLRSPSALPARSLIRSCTAKPLPAAAGSTRPSIARSAASGARSTGPISCSTRAASSVLEMHASAPGARTQLSA
jgi:hypothetical protein